MPIFVFAGCVLAAECSHAPSELMRLHMPHFRSTILSAALIGRPAGSPAESECCLSSVTEWQILPTRCKSRKLYTKVQEKKDLHPRVDNSKMKGFPCAILLSHTQTYLYDLYFSEEGAHCVRPACVRNKRSVTKHPLCQHPRLPTPAPPPLLPVPSPPGATTR